MPIASLHLNCTRLAGLSPRALVHRLAFGASLLLLSAGAMSGVTVLSSTRAVSASADGAVFDQASSAATSGVFADQVQRSLFQDFGPSIAARADQNSLITNSFFEAEGQAQIALINPAGQTASAESVFEVVFSVLTAQDFNATVQFDLASGLAGGLNFLGQHGFLLEDDNTGADIASLVVSGDGPVSQVFSGVLQAGTYRMQARTFLAANFPVANAQGDYSFFANFSDAIPGNAVPLPGSAALACLGLALLSMQRRRASAR
jgi:hypothetical protein